MAAARIFLPEVESLRGIAIALVVFHHFDGMLTRGLATSGINVGWLRAYISAGHSGVTLFFVLSAFCLSLPFFRQARESRPSMRDFYRRRALRILPGYLTAVLAGTVFWAQSPSDLLAAVPYVFFLNSFSGLVTPLTPFCAVWWSLATEVQFYLLLPLLPLCLRSPRAARLGRCALAGYAALYAAIATQWITLSSVPAQLTLNHSILGFGPAFLIGILIAWIVHRHADSISDRIARTALLRSGGMDLLLLGCVFALGQLLSWVTGFGIHRAEGPYVLTWHVLEAALWGAIVLLMVVAPLRTKAFFSNRLLGTLGLWSFSIYLIHLPLIVFSLKTMRLAYPGRFLTWDMETTALVAVLWVVCLALSAFTYQRIERPFLARKARLGGIALEETEMAAGPPISRVPA